MVCAPSCSYISNIVDAFSGVIDNTSDPADIHEYTAEEYDFPNGTAGFVSRSRTDYLGYKNLNEKQKLAYDNMYRSAMLMDEALFYVGDCTTDDVTVAFHALTYDNPQLIWLPSTYGISESEGGTYVRFVDDENSYGYIMTPSQRDAALDEMYAEIDAFVAKNLLNTMTDYEIELAVHDWLCQQITYDDAAAESVDTEQDGEYANAWTAYGAIVEDKAVCAGYVGAMQLVLNYLGLNCASLRVMSENEMHVVCIVEIEGDWVYADPTWDDKTACGLEYTHDYFNLTYDEISTTHEIFAEWDDVLADGEKLNSNFNIFIPEATSKDYNYYKLQNLQINSESEFKSVVVREFKSNAVSLEFQLTYCDPTNKTIDRLIDRLNIIKEIERHRGRLSSIQYAVLNNGAFCIKLNFKK